MSPLRIKFLINQPIPYNIDLFNALASHPGISIEVLYLLLKDDQANQNFKQLPPQRYPWKVLPSLRLGDYAFNPTFPVHLFARDYDVLIIAGYNHPTLAAAVFLAYHAGRPWLLWGDTWRSEQSRNFLVQRLRRIVLKRTFSTAAGVLATGKAGMESIIALGCPPGSVHNLTYAVSPERICQLNACGERRRESLLATANGRPIILSTGQLTQRKGYDVLIDALSLAKRAGKDFLAIISGAGPLEDMLKAHARKLGLSERIIFTGFIQQDDLAGCFSAADIFVLATQWDAWPLVISEAMHWSLPIITTDRCMAAPDLVRDGKNGYIVPADDSPKLADRIIELLDSREKRLRFKEESATIIRAYTPKATADRLAQTLGEILPSKGSI